MKNSVTLFLFLLFSYSSSAFIIETTLLKEPTTGKKIALYGDCHEAYTLEEQQFEKDQKEYFFNKIVCGNKQLFIEKTQSLSCLLECEPPGNPTPKVINDGIDIFYDFVIKNITLTSLNGTSFVPHCLDSRGIYGYFNYPFRRKSLNENSPMKELLLACNEIAIPLHYPLIESCYTLSLAKLSIGEILIKNNEKQKINTGLSHFYKRIHQEATMLLDYHEKLKKNIHERSNQFCTCPSINVFESSFKDLKKHYEKCHPEKVTDFFAWFLQNAYFDYSTYYTNFTADFERLLPVATLAHRSFDLTLLSELATCLDSPHQEKIIAIFAGQAHTSRIENLLRLCHFEVIHKTPEEKKGFSYQGIPLSDFDFILHPD